MMIIKKGRFSDVEILEIHQQINSETRQEDPIIKIKTVKTEKQEHSNQFETQSNISRNISHPNTEEILTQEEKKNNVGFIKRIMSEKKIKLPSFSN